MKEPLENRGEPTPDRGSSFETKFLIDVHRLLEMGFFAIGKDDYSNTDEEVISGDIREAIEGILDANRERWMANYSVENEKPVQQTWLKKSERNREGKKRQKIDLEIVTSESSPRRRFSFEAKLLCDSNSVSSYCGAGGMGCFIKGEYARNETNAGMVGFVQKRSLAEWLEKLETKIKEKTSELKLRSDPAWGNSGIEVANVPVKISQHGRDDKLPEIGIFHSFLGFSSIPDISTNQ